MPERPSSPAPDQRGSVLMLMPAAVLVLVILGSIAVDSSLAFLGQRELNSFATSAANVAAASAVDPAVFYSQNRIVLRQDRAEEIARSLEGSIGSGVRDVTVAVEVDAGTVTVTAVGTVDGLFARAVPGVHHVWTVRATSTATARRLAGP